MRTFLAKYRLNNGAAGTLHVIARNSCDALVVALDTFGERLCRCSVRPA